MNGNASANTCATVVEGVTVDGGVGGDGVGSEGAKDGGNGCGGGVGGVSRILGLDARRARISTSILRISSRNSGDDNTAWRNVAAMSAELGTGGGKGGDGVGGGGDGARVDGGRATACDGAEAIGDGRGGEAMAVGARGVLIRVTNDGGET